MKFPHAAKGVKKIYSAQILSLIATVFTGIVSVFAVFALAAITAENDTATFISGGATMVLGLAAVVLMVVGGIINIVGYIQAAMDEQGFKRAIVCTIIGIVLAVVSSFFTNLTGFLGWLGTALYALSQIFNLLVVFFSISGLMNLSAKCHREDMVVKGTNILKVIEAIYILYILALIITRVFRENAFNTTLAVILTVAAIILSVVQYFLYLSYLGKASKMLKEN